MNHRTSTLLTCTALGFASALTLSSYGAALVYEPFDDPDPTLNGNTAGTGFSGNWSGGWPVASGSYTYGGLLTSGNRAEISSGRTGSSNSPGSTLSGAGLMNDGATLWFSALTLTQPVASGNMDFGFAIGTNNLGGSNNIPMGNDVDGGQGLGFSIKSGQIRATAWDASDGTAAERGPGLSLSNPDDYGEVFLIVGEIIWGTGGADDIINLYAPDTDLNQGAVVSTFSRDLDQSNFDRISFANKADNLPVGIDEIRFGASYADVTPVPEPGSLALLGLGGLMMARRRRG